MRWCSNIDPRKVMNCDDPCKEFLNQYSYNTDLPITLRDLELLKQEEKEGLTNYLARWRAKATYMVGRPSEIDQVSSDLGSTTQKTTARREYLKNCTIGPYPLTLNGQFLREGDNFPFYGFPEPCYIKEKGPVVLGLEIFNDYHLLGEEVFTVETKEKSTKDWVDLAGGNIFGMLFGQGYRKKEDLAFLLSLAMSNNGFNHANFIAEVQLRAYGHSNLIINQTSHKWKVGSEALAPY
ncbi:hypothetical protein Cgig2_024804 [Carnegiea gigantea]|uniref:Uncharacterized protein n=1 Tax=Carnegiea gigantea TaxID=171969 RepID=A0A9Q1GNE1_9CARY|nr:hypothetical protein Cgig2_024804 [Carnegiea gigantea]